MFKKKYEVVAIHKNIGQLNDGRKYRTRFVAKSWTDYLNARLRTRWAGFDETPWVYQMREL